MRKSSQGSKAAAQRRSIQAYALHAAAANGFADAAVANVEQRLKSAGARPLNRVQRTMLAAAWAAIRGAVRDLGRPLVAWWRGRQQASATYAALAELDARTLHDLGFDRSELSSVAAEVAGTADRTRAHAVPRLRRSFR